MIETQRIVKMHLLEGKSIRAICREVGIPEGNKSYLARLLKEAGYQVRRGKLGFRVGDKIRVSCPMCKKEREIISRGIKLYVKLCRTCATAKSHKDNPRIGRAESHYNWKGGINLNKQGYIVEYVKKDNPYFRMAANSHDAGGYILQHRLVMAKHLGRLLKPNEVVHHINGNKQDNRVENLKLTLRETHGLAYQSAYQDGYVQAMKDNKNLGTAKYGMVKHGTRHKDSNVFCGEGGGGRREGSSAQVSV